MASILALIQVVGPLLLRGAEAGTLVQIAETAAELFALLRPLFTDPAAQARLDDLAATVAATAGVRPAQPEDPVFARQGATHFGGR